MKIDEIEIKEKQEEHKCVYDEIIIRKGEDPASHTSVIRVYTDCSCDDSAEMPFITFHDNDVVDLDKNFTSWFSMVANYFVANGFKIKDLR